MAAFDVQARVTVLLAAMLPIALCDDLDPSLLLSQARAKILDNTEELPRYVCRQTVHRFRYQLVPAGLVIGCGPIMDTSPGEPKPRYMLSWSDRLKLDVAESQGAEMFSWAGARHFMSEDVESLVGGGTAGTGDFGPFLVSIFGGGASEYEYLGPQDDQGRSFAVYHYRVPLQTSRYQISLGMGGADRATVAYEGKFWIDPHDAELDKLTIEVPDPPQGAKACHIETTIDYQRVRIGQSNFLLPRLTVLKLRFIDAQRSENQTEYAGCHEFQSESVFRPKVEAVTAAPMPKSPATIPSGVRVKIGLLSKIDSDSAFAGDAIEGRLLTRIGKAVEKGGHRTWPDRAAGTSLYTG